MALYFLTYDLRNTRNYDALYDQLQEFNAVRILESTWCFNRHNTTAKDLRNYFGKFIDADDGIIVSEIAGWASRSTDGTPNDLG